MALTEVYQLIARHFLCLSYSQDHNRSSYHSKNGQLACTTAITRQYFYNDEDRISESNPCGIRVFTGMNSNAQRYFDSSQLYYGESFEPAIDLPTHGLNKISKSDVPTTITATNVTYTTAITSTNTVIETTTPVIEK